MDSTSQNALCYTKVEGDLERGDAGVLVIPEGASKGVAVVEGWRTRGKTIALGVSLLLLLLLSFNLIVPIIPSIYKSDRQVSVPVSCTNWVPRSSFAQFSPSGGDDQHPLLNKARNKQKTYMGTWTFVTKDFNASSAIRAMLGDESPYVESFLFTYLKYRLMDDKVMLSKLMKRGGGHRTVERTPKTVDAILSSFKYKDIVFPDEAQASCLAANLIDMYEVERMSSKDFGERAFWYNYRDFSQDPVDFVWSTCYQMMATYYGKDVVVFKEDSRSLDLNYYNYYKDGRIQSDFGDQTGTGEFVTPGFKQPSEVVGFHTYIETRYKSDMVPPFNHLSYAFYQIVYEDKPYVLLVDGLMNNGSNALCLDIVDDMPHFCDHQWTFTPAPANPTILPEIPKITGIFSICDPVDPTAKNIQCQPIPKALIERYKNDHKTSMDLDKVISNKLAHTLDIGDQKVLFTPLSEDKPIIM